MIGIGNNKRQKLLEITRAVKDNAEVYKRVFGSPDGLMVLKDLERRSFVSRTTYDPDSKKMALNEGRRSLFVYIKGLVDKDVEILISELTGDK